MGFVNTVDLLGEDQTMDMLLTGVIERYVDDREYASVADSAFRGCANITAIITPRAPVKYCYGLKNLVILDTNCTAFDGSMFFQSASKLSALVLRNTSTVAKLSPSYSSFTHTAIHAGNGFIYVPRILVDAYKAQTNWAAYGDQIRAIEDYTEDGTLDSPIDETKI